MPRPAELPTPFEPISASLRYIQRKSANEYSSSCPRCGGVPHNDGAWPDRFVLLLKSKTTGSALAWCRHCGYKWWPGADGDGWKLTPEERERWRIEAEQREAEERAAAEQRYQNVLGMLERDRIWEKWYDNLIDNPAMAKVWESRGLDLTWAGVWSLGYNPDFHFHLGDEGEFTSPTLTIPVFAPHTSIPHNIHNRLMLPPRQGLKYRASFKGLKPLPWLAAPELGYDQVDPIFIAEGEIKAMNVYRVLEDPKLQVVGLQGKNGFEVVVDQIKGRTPWICLDPDATQQAYEYAKAVGGARVIELPGKIDDLILGGGLGKRELRFLMHNARKVTG